jgi:hypothetical protein
VQPVIFQSKAHQVISKNPFFQKFFIPFFTSSYENRESRIKNLFRLKRACSPYLWEGCIISKRYEEKQKFIWSASKWGPVSQAPGGRRQGFRRCSHREETCQSTPKPNKFSVCSVAKNNSANQCESVKSVVKNQSKITNYAKQSQFPKKSNVYNSNYDNEL